MGSRKSMTINMGRVMNNGLIMEDYFKLWNIWTDENGEYTCAYCGCKIFRNANQKSVSHNSATIDHVKPLSSGQTSDLSNIVLACYTCNVTKKSKLWIPQYILRSVDGFWEKIKNPEFKGEMKSGVSGVSGVVKKPDPVLPKGVLYMLPNFDKVMKARNK